MLLVYPPHLRRRVCLLRFWCRRSFALRPRSGLIICAAELAALVCPWLRDPGQPPDSPPWLLPNFDGRVRIHVAGLTPRLLRQ